jgi:hypothetical protein
MIDRACTKRSVRPKGFETPNLLIRSRHADRPTAGDLGASADELAAACAQQAGGDSSSWPGLWPEINAVAPDIMDRAARTCRPPAAAGAVAPWGNTAGRGDECGDVEVGWIVVLVVLGAIVWATVTYVQQQSSNTSEGVVAEFRDLRLTPSELIVGYRRRPDRYPLRGMTASVEDSNHLTVYLTITNDAMTLLREVPLRELRTAGADARAFAARLNRAAGR